MLDSVLITTSLHCVLLAPSSSTLTGRNPVSMGGVEEVETRMRITLNIKMLLMRNLKFRALKLAKAAFFKLIKNSTISK